MRPRPRPVFWASRPRLGRGLNILGHSSCDFLQVILLLVLELLCSIRQMCFSTEVKIEFFVECLHSKVANCVCGFCVNRKSVTILNSLSTLRLGQTWNKASLVKCRSLNFYLLIYLQYVFIIFSYCHLSVFTWMLFMVGLCGRISSIASYLWHVKLPVCITSWLLSVLFDMVWLSRSLLCLHWLLVPNSNVAGSLGSYPSTWHVQTVFAYPVFCTSVSIWFNYSLMSSFSSRCFVSYCDDHCDVVSLPTLSHLVMSGSGRGFMWFAQWHLSIHLLRSDGTRSFSSLLSLPSLFPSLPATQWITYFEIWIQ